MPTASLVLPFAVPVEERSKVFTPNMEIATIMFLIEAKSKKRRLFDDAPKKKLFVSKCHYPFWAIPWENESLIIDGLGVFSSTIDFKVLPEVTLFIDDIERGASIREQFRSALAKHEQTFQNFAKIDKIHLGALITDNELLSTFFEYIKEAVSQKLGEDSDVILVPHKIDLQNAKGSAKKMTRFKKQVQSDIRSLEYIGNLLEESVRLHEQMIGKEIEFIRERFEIKISKLQPEVDKKIDRLIKERDAEIVKMNRTSQNQLRAKERDEKRLERELQRLELARVDFLRRRDARKRKHDEMGVSRWEHRIRIYENKIDEEKARIRALSELIEQTRRQNEAAVQKFRYFYQGLIDQEKKKIVEIEVQRNSVIETRQKEIRAQNLARKRIAGQIAELINGKREQEKELKRLAIPWRFEDITQLCLPFYLVCYQTEEKSEFQFFTPFKMTSSEGVVKTLRKTISGFRSASGLKVFLQPRSKVLSKVLDFVLEEKMRSDEDFVEVLLHAVTSGNVLVRQDFKETLTRGIEKLRDGGWVSRREGNALIKAYT